MAMTKLPTGDPNTAPRWRTPFGGSISQGAGETLQGVGNILTRGGFALLGLGLAKQTNTPMVAPTVAAIGGGVAEIMQQRWWRKEAEFFDEKYTQPYSQIVQGAYQEFTNTTTPVTITKEIQIPDKEGKTVTKTIPVTGFPMSRDPKTGQVLDVIPSNTPQGVEYYTQASLKLNSTIANSTIQYLDSTSLPMFQNNPLVSQKAAQIHQQYTKWIGQATGAFQQQTEMNTELTAQDKNQAQANKARFDTEVMGPIKAQAEITKANAAMIKAQRSGGGRGSSKAPRIDPYKLAQPADLYQYILTEKKEIDSTKAIMQGFGATGEAADDNERNTRISLHTDIVNEKLRTYLSHNLRIPPTQAEELIYRDPSTRHVSVLYRLSNQYPMVDPDIIKTLWYETDGDYNAVRLQIEDALVEQQKQAEEKERQIQANEPGLIDRIDKFLQRDKMKQFMENN